MTKVFLLLILCGTLANAQDYSVHHDGRTGKVMCIIRERDKASIPISTQNRDYAEFLRWDAAEKAAGRAGLVVADRAPDSIPAKEIERQRRLAVALTYIKAIPDEWENGTNDQKLMWAIKQALKELRDNTD